MIWQGRIDESLVEHFIDRVFEDLCHNSLHDFELLLADVAYSQTFHILYKDELEQECEDCNHMQEIESQVADLDELMEKLKDQRNRLQIKLDKTIKESNDIQKSFENLSSEYANLYIKHTNIKKNSIIFSMEDIDE